MVIPKLSVLLRLAALSGIFLMASGCNTGQTTSDPTNSDSVSVKYSKTLLIIGDDRSGSTGDIRKLRGDDYKELFSAISEKGGGAVAVSLIGNPQAQNREPYMLTLNNLEKIQPYDPRDTHLTLTEKSRIKLQNDRIIEANQKALEDNLIKINTFVTSTITNNIINYIPSGVDHTNLDDALSRMNTLINEPLYRDYENIIVVLVSDGRNQPGNGERPITSKLTHPSAKVFLVGWEKDKSCFETAAIEEFSSKDGMIQLIKNLK